MTEAFIALKEYCEKEKFKGWDPYDGLNSKIFQSLPFLKKSALIRLVMIQLFKRSPINMRRLALVPKEYNAKGISLFLEGYCNLWYAVKQNQEADKRLGSLQDIEKRIRELADLLLVLRSEGNYSGDCWGYNFDWQARRLFLFPKGTPTVVATTFCATALMEAYDITGEKRYLDSAVSSADFVVNDLHRTPFADGFLFSYSPLEGNDTVFNASLLGARLLSLIYERTGNKQLIELARKTIEACCKGQREDGAWIYGMLPVQGWVDSFHTGYNLMALADYRRTSGDKSFDRYIDRGTEYYLKNFFLSDGTPKYYDNKTYPIDIHCPGQLPVTLSHLGKYNANRKLVRTVMDWTEKNMRNAKKGYFFYQLKPGISSRISYMRWSNAFMFNSLSRILREESK